MPPVSYFNPVHKKSRTGGQTQKAKRKRDDIDLDLDNASVATNSLYEEQQPSDGRISPSYGSFPSVAHIQTASRELSNGYGASKAFLEAPNRSSDQPMRLTRSNASLGKPRCLLLGPRQYPSSGFHRGKGASGSGARQHHLAVLTVIMHQSLLQHDFVRAGRAWGMLLRSEANGHSMDLRSGYRWGLGAEILLRRQRQLSQASNQTSSAFEIGLSATESPDQYINSDGFEKARQYYNRLSLQYPYYKSFPNAIGPLDFHFAIFSLWIYVSANQEAWDAGVNRAAPAYAARSQLEQEITEDCQKEALRRAREISQQLDGLLSSPPYSDSEMFRKLKAMVDLWTADLAIAS